ncbi:DUF6683 family protein [uncultured Devosia sp.]|uniref:DUF6683 family protein n=1 Tax=uncultured Devosia sp. TaxID=211434 RepID=UPI0026115B1F|nr:DUF6683 family protein [uncultured Devosia sp.]
MTLRTILIVLLLGAMPVGALAQESGASGEVAATSAEIAFDASYRPSPSVSARLQREFLTRIRWSAGVAARDSLAAAFAERSPSEIWQELVEPDGLTTNNVVDALTAYWVLNWVAANGAYSLEIDSRPIQRQLRAAFAQDTTFHTLSDQQRQEMAEGYILNFLLEHAALNAALEQQDVAALTRLGTAATARFRSQMKVDLLSVVPGPEGFVARTKEDHNTPSD